MKPAAAALVLLLAAAAASAGDEPAIERLSLGTHWCGAEVAKEDLAGKVVLFVLYGS